MVLYIGGLAITPTVSGNKVFYWPQELQKFHGVKVPLRFNHAKDGGFTVGEAKFTYDEEKQEVRYTGVITNELVEAEVKRGGYQVSVGTLPKKTRDEGREDRICHRDGTCIDAPIFEGPRELSLVKNPGIPHSTLELLTEKNKDCGCKNKPIELDCESTPYIITSDEQTLNTEVNNMTEEVSTPNPSETQVKTEVEDPCPPGWKLVDGKCVKEPEKEDKPVESPAPVSESAQEGTKTVDINVNVTKDEAKTEKVIDVASLKTEMKAEILKEMGDKFTPKSDVKTSDSTSTINDWKKAESEKYTPEYIKKGLEVGKVTMHINKEDWIADHTQNLVTEAVSTSGTVAQVKSTTDIIIIPGSNTFEPIRSLGQFEALPTGQDQAKFWTVDVSAFGTATGVIDGKIGTVGAHTLTAITVSTAPRGVLQQVTKDQLRDFPPKFMEKLKEVMRLAAIKDEHNLIVQTLASTNNDFNNGTTVVTAGYPVHLRGDTGALCDSTVTEDAIAEFAPVALKKARRYLAQRGHNPVANRLVAIISSRAYDALITDSTIANYIEQGNPSISEQGLLSRFFGIEIMVSEELLVANNAQRNVVVVVGKAFALASQKEMEIQMAEQIEGQYVNITAIHDIGVEELDHSAYVIISSKND